MAHEVHPGLAVLREYIPDDATRREFISRCLSGDPVDMVAQHEFGQLFWGHPDDVTDAQHAEVLASLKLIDKFIRSL